VAEKLNKVLSDRSSGLTFDAVNLTVGKYLHHWLEDSVKSLVDAGKMAHSTFIRYEGIVNNHLKPALGHRKLKDLSRADVRRFYKEKGKVLAPRSVDYIHVTLQKALSQALRDDLIPRNVASGERPRSSRHQKEARALSPLRCEHCWQRLAESTTRPSISWPST